MVNDKVKNIALRICKEQGLELYDIESKNTDTGRVLRVYITSPNGISLADCASVSRMLNNELDIIDLVTSKYFLEVSSPGLERTLYKDHHYRQAIGETVKIMYRKDGKTLSQIGILREVTPHGLAIEIEGSAENVMEEFTYSALKKVRTVFKMKPRSRR